MRTRRNKWFVRFNLRHLSRLVFDTFLLFYFWFFLSLLFTIICIVFPMAWLKKANEMRVAWSPPPHMHNVYLMWWIMPAVLVNGNGVLALSRWSAVLGGNERWNLFSLFLLPNWMGKEANYRCAECMPANKEIRTARPFMSHLYL